MPIDMTKLVNLEDDKAGKAVEHGMIATVEGSSTASRPYAIGERFYYTGKLYIATAPIASGGTITVSGSGQNCKLDVLGDDVTDLSTALNDIVYDTTGLVLYENSLSTLGKEAVVAKSTQTNSTLTMNGGFNALNGNSVGRYPVTQGEYYLIVGKTNASTALLAHYTANGVTAYISGSSVANFDPTINKMYCFKALGSYVFVDHGTNNDSTLYHISKKKISKSLPTTVYVGNYSWCDYPDVQSALLGITDDSATKPYIIHVCPGTYPTFSMRRDNREEDVETIRTTARWISIEGENPYSTIFSDNRGNRILSPCDIFTNGVIKNITFEVQADSTNYSPYESQTSCYAVHQDFGTCNTQYYNCRFLCNVGPGFGAGLHQNNTLDLFDCYFESTCDGSFGTGAQTGQGAIFVHTYSSAFKAVGQKLRIHNSSAVATAQANGGRFAMITSSATLYGSEYSFEFQNFGCFGNNGAQVNLQDPDNDLLSAYNFNNLPATLNTAT